MAMTREEIDAIAKVAAERSMKEDCMTIATHIDSVKDDAIDPLHTAIYNYGVSLSRQRGEHAGLEEEKTVLLKKIKNAQDAVEETIVGTGYARPEDVAHVTTRLARIYQLVKDDSLYDAMTMVEDASNDMFQLLLKTVVACECSEEIALAKHVGHEALEKILKE